MSSMRRLFIGLAPPIEIAEAVQAAVRPCFSAHDAARLRFLAPIDLHVTLAFLGAVDEAAVPRLEDELARAFESRRSLALEIVGTGAFPTLARPRVLWAGIRSPHERDAELGELERAARQAAVSAGVAMLADGNAPFRPHMTVARLREHLQHGALQRFLALAHCTPWRADELALFESSAAGERASTQRYVKLRRIRLAE
jgi:2'-5' RNA ligase